MNNIAKRRFLFINQVTGPVFVDILNAFIDEGVSCELLTGQIELAGVDLSEKVKVHSGILYKRAYLLQRIFTWLVFTIQIAFMSKRFSKYTDIFLVSNPPFAPLLLSLFKKKGCRIHILIFDIYPEILVESKYIKPSNFIVHWWKRKNQKIFSQCDNLFTISNSM